MTGEVEMPSSPIRVECLRRRIPDVRHPGGMSAKQNFGFSKRICGALPYPDSLREKHMALAIITPRMIAYPIRICCPDHWLKCTSLATSFRQPATAHVPPPSDGVSGHLLSWIPKKSPQSRIALVIKKLSKHQNLTQFD